MDRRAFLGGLGLVVMPLAAEAQPTGQVYRVGLVSLVSRQADSPLVEAFRQGLRESAGAEAQRIVIETRSAPTDKLPALVRELLQRKVDVIVADTTPAIRAAMQATTTVPIVMAYAADPVGSGLVNSLARPGGNVTGLSLMLPDIAAKRLQLLKEILPKVTRIAVLWHPDLPWHRPMLKAIEAALPSLGVQAVLIPLRGAHELEAAFATMARERVEALFVGDNPEYRFYQDRLLALAARHRLPTLFGIRAFAESGGLISYGPNLGDMFRRAGGYVDKIRKGARPADLPVEQASTFELVINLKTAKALGLTIPPSLLQRADQVIE